MGRGGRHLQAAREPELRAENGLGRGVADRVVDRRTRPIIDAAKFGEKPNRGAFIDQPGVQAVMREMTDAWVATTNGHGTDMKRRLRRYIALVASTGIRAGLELLRVRWVMSDSPASTGGR
jgi:hypothetical protein